jgi:hypothetical protein
LTKTITGELQILKSFIDEAMVNAADYEVLEQLIVNMAPHWHKLVEQVNKNRPQTDRWLEDQLANVHFRTQVADPKTRATWTRVKAPYNGGGV